MTQRATPIPATDTFTAKPATNNHDRLLAILERNAASVKHESELARRLRDAIRTIKEKSSC